MNIKLKTSLLLFLTIFCTVQPTSQGFNQNEKQTIKKVICFDLDDTLTTKPKPSTLEIVKLLCNFAYKNPLTVLRLFYHRKTIIKKGYQIASQDRDMSTHKTVKLMIDHLKNEGYGDFSEYQDAILNLAIKPKPLPGIIALLKDLKTQGYAIVAATNQDYPDNIHYRLQLERKGVDLSNYIDFFIVAHADNCTDNVDTVMQDVGVKKPDNAYYKKTMHLLNQWYPKAQEFYFVDDKKENVEGAMHNGFTAFHIQHLFTKKRKKSYKLSEKELGLAVKNLKTAMRQQGFSL